MKKRIRGVLLAGILAVAGGGVAVVATTVANAATGQICEQYGTTTQGNYTIMNNRWGTSATQCINVTNNGFQIVQQDGTGNLSGAPVSYPAIYLGCHYSNCSPNSPLPRQISQISSANSSVGVSLISSGTYDAAYDIWLNADTNVSGVQDTEIMIWLHHTGSIQPVGSNTGQTVSIAGRSWAVWTGNNGSNNVVSYVGSGISSLSFDVMAFVRDTLGRGSNYGTNSWYLTSVQMGFEPWIGGVGLAVNSFSATVTGGTPPTTARTTAPTTARTTAPTTARTTAPTTGGGGQSGSCTAAYRVVNSWSGGFQAQVDVTASGSINGWTVKMTLPSGVTIGSLWNGVSSGNSGAISVKNASYNPTAPTNFGFVANGSSSPAPSGISCTSP